MVRFAVARFDEAGARAARLRPSLTLPARNWTIRDNFGLYAEGVELQSPGSRSAPWENTASFCITLKALYNAFSVDLDERDLAQGALAKPRDPGLWSATPSA